MVAIGDGVADADVFDAGDGDNVARFGGVDFDALQSLPAKNLGYFYQLLRAIAAAQGVIAGGKRAVFQPSDGEPADVIVVVEIVGLKLRRGGRIEGGSGERIDDQIEQWLEIFTRMLQVAGRGGGASIGVNHGKIEL